MCYKCKVPFMTKLCCERVKHFGPLSAVALLLNVFVYKTLSNKRFKIQLKINTKILSCSVLYYKLAFVEK